MGLSCLKQKGPRLNKASTTPTSYYTQEIESPAVETNLPSSLAEPSEEPPVETNFSSDVALETINLSDDLMSSDRLQLMQLCHCWRKLSSFHY